MTSYSVVMMLLEFLLPRSRKMYWVGFFRRKNLHRKNIVSPSSLFTKIIGVLARNGGGKWNQTLVGRMSLLNMALVCIHVRLGTSHFVIFLPPWVWIISFDCSSTLCHVTMTSDPLMSKTAKSSVVPPICSREVFPLQFSTSL